MIVLKGRYTDQSPMVCTSKKLPKIAKWFEDNFESEDEEDETAKNSIIKSILNDTYDLDEIREWLFRYDMLVDRWD